LVAHVGVVGDTAVSHISNARCRARVLGGDFFGLLPLHGDALLGDGIGTA
jgi:hypothetical protein